MDQKQFLITGGSGFLGINLIRHLLRNGHKVRSLDLVAFDYPEKDKIESQVGDIRDKEIVNKMMNGVDFVVHCAAALPLYKEEDIFSTDVDGTRNVMEAAYNHGVQKAIHISSTAIYKLLDHHLFLESDEVYGAWPYAKAKIMSEEVCLEFRKKGMCIPIIRPKSFIGPERLGAFAIFYDWAKEGHGFPMVGSGNNRYQLLDVEDLCDAIYLCITGEKGVVNDVFNIGAKEFTTMKEDYQAVLDKAGFGKKIIGFPAGLVIFGLRILEALRLSPLYRWMYETAGEDSFVSIEKAERIIGYRPKYSNKDALLRNYEWYLANVDNIKGHSGISHRVTWKQGALGIVKKFF